MNSWELSLPPERPQRIKGRFVKGHTAWHKGKKVKWNRTPEVDAKCRSNLIYGSKKGHVPWNIETGTPILMFKNGVEIGSFRSMGEAERKTGIRKQYISQCIKGKQKHAHGFEFKKLTNEEEHEKE